MLVSVFCTFFTFSSCIFRVAEIRNCLFIENNVSFFLDTPHLSVQYPLRYYETLYHKKSILGHNKGVGKTPTPYGISHFATYRYLSAVSRGYPKRTPPLFIHILSVYTFSQNSEKVITRRTNTDIFVQVQIRYTENPVYLHFKVIAQYNLPFAVHLLQPS